VALAAHDPLALLHLAPAGEGRFRVSNEGDPAVRDVVFGGQLLGQMIVAASAGSPGKSVRTIHTIFARAARVSAPTELAVEPMHDGRSFASASVTAWQGDRLCARSLVLLDVPDPDLIRHAAPAPEVPGPDEVVDAGPSPLVFPGAELRIVGGVDTWSADAPVGPAELFAWVRYRGAPDDIAANQAILAWGTDGFLIGTALRPHAGIGQADAHKTLSTGVVGHTLTFHEPFRVRDWLLIAHESPHAGGGRSHGRAQVFTREGRLVASFVQDNMIRAAAPGGAGPRSAL
jgi:acyl-CoA thioesterase II